MGCGASSVAPVENDRPQDSKTDVVEVPNPKECASPTCTKDEGMKKDVSCRANSTKDDSSPVCSASGNDSKAASPLKKCGPSIPTDSSKSDVASESSPKLKDVQVESCSQSSPLATAPSQSSDTFRGMNSGAQETSSSQDQEQLVRMGSKHSEQ